MKIQQVQPNTTFEANKRRFISLESHEQLKDILTKMNNEAEYKSNDIHFESSYLTDLFLKRDKEYTNLYDSRHYLKKVSEEEQLKGETFLKLGKTEILIDNKSGEIIDHYKPFFTTWKSVMKKINGCLLEFNNNYHKQDVVNKKWFNIKGFTKKGYENLQKLIK